MQDDGGWEGQMKVKHIIKPETVKGMLGKIAENVAKQHIKENRYRITDEYFGETPDKIAIEFLSTKPQSKKLMGKIKNQSIAGWHGDLVMLAHTPDEKVAFVFEIKFGHIHISKPQHTFFGELIRNPSRYHSKLDKAVVSIVRCFNLDLENGSMEMIFEPYRGDE
jgi:hypothetical protein